MGEPRHEENRALAVSLVGAGLAVAPMTVSPLAAWLIEAQGWRTAQLTIGVADRLGAKRVLMAGLLVQAVAIGSYVFVSRLGEFYAVALVFGLAYGGVMPLYAVLVRDYFAPQIMGTVLGAAAIALAFPPVRASGQRQIQAMATAGR